VDDANESATGALVRQAHAAALAYLEALPERPVRAATSHAELRAELDHPLTAAGDDPAAVVADLARWGETATAASAGPRYFGFVVGGSLPVALAADHLVATWDQNGAMAAMSPLASVTEEVAARWLLGLLGLPAGASVGFVTGCQAANTTCIAAARHHVLAAHGWDVERDGLQGAPRVTTLVGAQRHATVDVSLRFLGLGAPTVLVDADDQGRMVPSALAAALDGVDGPTIVVAQAGNVNTGAFDPFGAVARLTHERGGWLHIDGAFGLWAGAAPARRHLVAGMADADSWATDGHKWLNVPYDCGFAITAHPDDHRAVFASTAGYYVQAEADGPRDGMDWVPEASRRARGVATYAALRTLGVDGVADLVEQCCRLAAHFAELMAAEPGVAVCNDVVLNQVLLRFRDDDAHTRAVVAAVQDDGTCWAGGSTWEGQAVMRVSVSNWATTIADIRRSAAAIVAAHRTQA
jgi:glutamate/tyrosine decarboxylase-like PLP-dependent enzyme